MGDVMIASLILAALVLGGTIGTLVELIREGRGPSAPPVSHPLDRRFLPPARGGSRLA